MTLTAATIDEQSSKMIITIMPDYGHSPYAWLKSDLKKPRHVGLNVGGYLCKPTEFPISDDLHDAFCAWGLEFEVGAEKAGFDWTAFHAKGRDLTLALKTQVGEGFRVLYAKPVEDPQHSTDEVVEIVCPHAEEDIRP